MPAYRPLAPSDLAAARALFEAEHVAAPFLARANEYLEASGRGDALAVVAFEGSELRGVILSGAVAGTAGAATISAVCVAPGARRRGVGSALVAAAISAFAARHVRLVTAEVPVDPRTAPATALMKRSGFAEEGRLKDFVAHGIDLAILVRRLKG